MQEQPLTCTEAKTGQPEDILNKKVKNVQQDLQI